MFKRIAVTKLTGQEAFKHAGAKKFTVQEFWQYGFSNLNSNVLRGALAEFLVENALKENKDITVRNPWGDYDVVAPHGKTIEVKCCSYIQDWDQNKLSTILWGGLKAKALYWNEAVAPMPTNLVDYKSDIYVLALFKHQDPTTLDILDLDQWCFYVLEKANLKGLAKDRKSITLKALEKEGVLQLSFSQLPDHISGL